MAVAPGGSARAGETKVDKRSLRLRVSTHHGFQPLDLRLDGELKKVEAAEISSW